MAGAFMRELLRYRRNRDFLILPFSKSHFSSSQPPSDFIQICHHPTRFHQIQSHFITSGFLQDQSMASRLLKLSLDSCDIDYTLMIFRCIDSPDTFCVNTVIKAYACSSSPNKVVGFYFDMLREDGVLFRPNSFTFPPLISSCTKTRDLELGRECHGQAVKVGVDGVLYVENALIHMYACCASIDVAWKVFDEMPVRDLVSWNSMVDGYVKVGNIEIAHKVFDKMPQRNSVSWNAMMKGYLDVKSPGVVLKLFRVMVGTGGRGNDTTFVSVLTACGRSCRLKEGKSVHGALIRTFVSITLIISTSLIDMYSKCGRPDLGHLLFDRMSIKNLVCWNAIISGHSIHGNPSHGLRLFNKMLKIHELTPDEVTYVGVLCACAREGLLTEGKTHFLEMTDRFKLNPSFAHYWCMANIYASHGLVHDAVEILKRVPMNMGVSSWGGLLGLCRFKGEVETGERIAKALIENEPLNDSYHMLLVVIYAVAGRWEDVAKMKSVMKERGVRVPGFSLVELTEMVENLQVGDKWEDRLSKLSEYG